MTTEQGLSSKLREIDEEWNRITSSPNPPRSMMNVIEYGLGEKGRGEVYVTRFLRYLLDSSEPHGLDDEFLKVFLEGYAARFGFEEPLHDLSNVRVRKEVWIRNRDDIGRPESTNGGVENDEHAGNDSPGRVDLVVDKPGDWFLLIELKFSAEENNLVGSGHSQTEFYTAATHIGETPKFDYEGSEHYLYIHKTGTGAAVEPEFVNWVWEAVDSEVLKPFVETNGSSIPHRSLVHLNELRDDIKTFTDMTSEDPHETEKVELYLEHYPVLNDLNRSFESRWEAFTNQWNTNLAVALDDSIETYYEVEDGIIAVDTDDDVTDSTWYFRAKHKDWQTIYKDGWWTPVVKAQWQRMGELAGLHKKSPDHDTLRVSFNHRMNTHRDAAIEDNTLIITFRNARANSEPFYTSFAEKFAERRSDVMAILPESTEWLGQKSDQFMVQYRIPTPGSDNETAPDDFFDAYTAALRMAFIDLVIDNAELTNIISAIYNDALEIHMNSFID